MKQIFVISSPSGGGKTTLAKHLMKLNPELEFSVSATTRNMRPNEFYAKDYYFLTKNEFAEKIKNDEFVEYEEIYGNFYGTLKAEIEKKINSGKKLLFDVDVKGALSLKKYFKDISLLIFVAPPSIDELKKRLKKRKTETDNQLRLRIERAEMELKLQDEFDIIIINKNLNEAKQEIENIAQKYI